MPDSPDDEMRKELLAEFLDGCDQTLNEVANWIVRAEADVDDKDLINQIFRAVHTIKGNASILNLSAIRGLAHAMEDLMNEVRQDRLALDSSVTNVLLASVDYLKGMVANVKAGREEKDDPRTYDDFVNRIACITEEKRRVDVAFLWGEVQEAIECFGACVSMLDAEGRARWDRVARTVEAYAQCLREKDATGSLHKESVDKDDPRKELEGILTQDFDEVLGDEDAEKVLRLLEALERRASASTKGHAQEALKEYNEHVLREGLTSFSAEILLDHVRRVELSRQAASVNASDRDSARDVSGDRKTMRVYESTIDHFLDLIGDLVVVGETYGYIQKRFSEELGPVKSVVDLKKNNEAMNNLSLALQASVLGIRRVAIKPLLDKAPRIARDVALETGKKIRVEIQGQDTRIDKSFMESLEGPFIHLVRNAADHGIEPPAQRVAQGKEEEGCVLIKVLDEDDKIEMVIQDDGQGIDPEAIFHKAVERGLVSDLERGRLSDQDILGFLFVPGFSTAERVTDISGRGVGMDVVKRNIEAMGGRVRVESVVGEGSRFILEVPKTVCVKIMEGFLVSAKGQRFILPMINVGESFCVRAKDMTMALGEGECLTRHGRVFSVKRLDRLLNLTGQDQEEMVGIILEGLGRGTILLVDKILGTQQVVVKTIEGLKASTGIIAGGAILGDEKVAIVLNLEELDK